MINRLAGGLNGHGFAQSGNMPRLKLPQKLKSLSKRQRRIFAIIGVATFFSNYDGALLNLALNQIQRSLRIAEGNLGALFSLITLGTALSPLITSQADRYGRRKLLLCALAAFSILSGASAFAWNAASFVAMKFLTVMFAAVEGSLAIVIMAEEVNADARGMALGVLGVISACGYGLAALGFAWIDIFPLGWRGLFLFAFFPVLLVVPLWRLLPESTRFEKAGGDIIGSGFFDPFRALIRGYPWRFVMVGAVMFLNAMGGTPGGLMQSEYLQQAHHWTPAGVSKLVLAGGAAGVLGGVVAGYLSDHIGRRAVAVTSMIAAPVVGALFFNSAGLMMIAAWVLALFAQTAGSTMLNVFSAELFPTSHRSTASSAIAVMSTLGGSAGLLLESWLYRLTGTNWHAVSALMATMIAAAIIVALFFPETARAELEELSPERVSLPRRRYRARSATRT
jgi:putative MFS transporter